MSRLLEFVQLPPLTFTAPLLPVLLPTVPDVDVTMPPVIVRLPVPKLPILKVLEFVQLPPLTFTVPLLPVLLPTVPLAFARMLPPSIVRLPWLVLPTITVVLLDVSPLKVTSPKAGWAAASRSRQSAVAKRSGRLVKCEFIFDFDTDAALERIEKKQKMRRTGHNRRRTGQRDENGGEIHHSGHGEHGVDCKLIQKLTNFNLLPNLTFYSVLSVSSVVK
jgi:hypothetical protein